MTVWMDVDTVQEALALNLAGDVYGAYDKLAQFGDLYAIWAKQIVDPNGSAMARFVKDIWESRDPGSVSEGWFTVALQHQRQYLEAALQNPSADGMVRLPDTYQIENSYYNALVDNNLSPNQ